MNISFIPALICSLSYADNADACTPFYDCESSVLIVSDSHSLIFPNLLSAIEENAEATATTAAENVNPPVKEISDTETLQAEAPQNVAPQNVAPQDAAPQNAAPQNAAPQDAAPQDAAPQNAAPQNAAPQNAAPQDVAPQDAAPQNAAPQNAAPQDAAPQNAAPQNAAPQDAAPQDAAPQNVAPQAKTTQTTAPAEIGKPAGPAEEFTRSSGGWASWLVSTLAIGVAISLLYYARKLQAGLEEGTTPPSNEPPTPQPTSPAPIADEPSAAECQMREMEAASNASTDENLKGLLLDRLEDIKLYSENTEKWAKEAVGLIDEIGIMRNAYSGTNGDVLDTISSILKTQMQDRNCEILDSDTWEPSIQRAIKINRILPKGSTPRIAKKYSSGIKVEGNLIRKQEIELEQEVAE